MTQTISCDISEFQAPVNAAYPHDWLIFRACDGTYRDQHFTANYAWARKAASSGKLAGYSVYVVFRPGVDAYGTAAAMLGKIDAHVTVMVDVESWGGQIHGDHSTEITKLVTNLQRFLGDKRRVLAYGNSGDLANIYPHRPAGLRLVVAAYGPTQPTTPGLIGWQYSDGQAKWAHPAGLPISSPPFDNCDHNVFPGLTPADLAAALGVGTTPPADPMEDVMAMYDNKKHFEESMAALMKQAAKDAVDARIKEGFAQDYDGTPTTLYHQMQRIGPDGYEDPAKPKKNDK